MTNILRKTFAFVVVLSVTACTDFVIPGQHIRVDTVLKSCLEAKYDDPSGLTLGIEKVRWEDKLVQFGTENLPAEQKRMYEQQFTSVPQDKYLVFDVYIKNNSKQPLMWPPRNAPVFHLLDGNGTKYIGIGQTVGNMKDITATIILGQQSSINPTRNLKGTSVFDVPTSGSYTLIMSKGRWGGGFNVFAGGEMMRCTVPK